MRGASPLLGPNGAGKTTTISILTTTLAPAAGRATIDGHDIVTEASAVRRRVRIVFQRPSLDQNLTAEELPVVVAIIAVSLVGFIPVGRRVRAGRAQPLSTRHVAPPTSRGQRS